MAGLLREALETLEEDEEEEEETEYVAFLERLKGRDKKSEEKSPPDIHEVDPRAVLAKMLGQSYAGVAAIRWTLQQILLKISYMLSSYNFQEKQEKKEEEEDGGSLFEHEEEALAEDKDSEESPALLRQRSRHAGGGGREGATHGVRRGRESAKQDAQK